MANNDWQSRLKTGRNDECPCGSKKKYKKCHLQADEKAQSEALAKTNAESAAHADHDHDHEGNDHHDHDHAHEHKHEKGGPVRPHTSTTTARQISAPRKTGAA
jgi:ABC-type Zn2+ transport system substrate-binding protein/surface adhesin